jgi:methionyl-tRNA formyltransferase
MNIFFMGNNLLGLQVVTWLREQGEKVVGIALHREGKRRFGEEILAAADLPAERVFDGAALDDPEVGDRVAALEPDIGISVLFGHILTPAFLERFPRGCVNLHPAYLPWNRGAHPNVWSIIEGTPAGVTLHEIDAGIDTGPILARAEVPVEPTDTGETLYRKLEAAGLALFIGSWPALKAGTLPPQPVGEGEGSFHNVRDLASLDPIDPDRTYTARELIDLIRARTFPPWPGAYFESEGRRVYLRLELDHGEEG